METREQSLHRLQAILDLLGPGSSLHTDVSLIKNMFGPAMDETLNAAEEFAKKSDCAFHYMTSDKMGVWTRASHKGQQ
jgi:hypothetical protein